MSNRFFAFGCSYTKYSFATWADYVGANFDEYYNYGRGGSSNTYIMNKFVKADSTFNMTSEDFVCVMFTGIGRFSYATKNPNKFEWKTPGDLYENYYATKDPTIKSFVENMYSEDWAVYSSWIAMKTVKSILTAKNIPHKFLMGIDNSNYLEQDGSKWGSGDRITLTPLTQECYSLLDVDESLDQWVKRKKFSNFDFTFWKGENNRHDRHPTQKMHYDFLSEKMPEFITEKSAEYFKKATELFNPTTQNEQGTRYGNELQGLYDKSYFHGLL